MRRIRTILYTITFILTMTIPATASSGYALGWTYMPMASGFTVKVPIRPDIYIQPLFAVSLYEHNGQAEGNYSVGLRCTYGLPALQQIHPYLGAGLGHRRTFHGSNLAQTMTDEYRTGASAFFGLEYRKYTVRPAVELGLTALRRADGSFRVGTSFNAGIYYHF